MTMIETKPPEQMTQQECKFPVFDPFMAPTAPNINPHHHGAKIVQIKVNRHQLTQTSTQMLELTIADQFCRQNFQSTFFMQDSEQTYNL